MNKQEKQTKTQRQTIVWWLPEGRGLKGNKEKRKPTI